MILHVFWINSITSLHNLVLFLLSSSFLFLLPYILLLFFSVCLSLISLVFIFSFLFIFRWLPLLYSPPASFFTFGSHRWILPLLYGKAFRSVSLVIQQGATTGIVPGPAGATPPNGQMTTPWSLRGQLSTTGRKTHDLLLLLCTCFTSLFPETLKSGALFAF